MRQPAFVSICLLTYNRACVLPRSLDSLLAQSYKEFELIINDDCSTDNTSAVCAEYEKKDVRVRYCRNEQNLRYAGNQNAALGRAQSDLVAIVHDGDVYRADCVEKWVAVLQRHPNVGLVFNASDALDDFGNITTRHRHPFPQVVPGRMLIDEVFRQYSSPIFGIVMLRKHLAIEAGGFSTDFPVLADVDMWLRILMRADAGYINEALYQIHPRETDHCNRGVNWKVLTEHQRIFVRNAVRRFDDREKQGELIDQLQWRYRLKIAHDCLWSLKRARVGLAIRGVRLLGSTFIRDESNGKFPGES